MAAASPTVLFIGARSDLQSVLSKLPNPRIAYAASFEKVNEISQSVVVMPLLKPQAAETEEFLKRIDSANAQIKKILVVDKLLPLEQLAELNNRHGDLRFVAHGEPEQLQAALNAAIQEARNTKPEDPEKTRVRTQKRKQKRVQRVSVLQKALMAVHAASSVAEIESQLYSTLKQGYQLAWVRIFLHGSEHLDSQLGRIQGQHLFRHGLLIGAQHLGKIAMGRTTARPFAKAEDEALIQISESVALALDRLAKIDQAENLKQQWESTFDAISEPLCVTDDEFRIIRTNRAFLAVTKLKNAQAQGQNCFKLMGYGHQKPEDQFKGFVLSRTIQKAIRHFDVTVQKIGGVDEEHEMHLVLFRDVTERKRLEDRILESSKMAELGTIGSSIAHDINNPLGGMLSFLQLIKMDMPSDHPLRADIDQMETACHRCKEIVENLLQFSRRQDNAAAESLDLRSAVRQAVKIIELQTRSLGIEIEIIEPETEVKMLGHFNLLAQALSQVFQSAFEAVANRLKQNPGFHGRIRIEVQASDHMVQIVVSDNGAGARAEQQNRISGLNQTLLHQILSDHGGTLDIISRSNVGTTAKIAFMNV